VPGDLRLDLGPVRDVRRVAQHQVDAAVEAGQHGGVPRVPRHDGDPPSGGGDVARQPGQRCRIGLDGVHLRVAALVGDGNGHGARSAAQVHHHRPPRTALRGGEGGEAPLDQQLGLRPRDEDAGADREVQPPERCRPGQVLQRHPRHTVGDQRLVPLELPPREAVGEQQPATRRPEDVRRQQLGVDPGTGHPGGTEPGRRRGDGPAQLC
jgi:hypothetical protein